MPGHLDIKFASPANAQVLRHLSITEPSKAIVYAPEEVDTWHLGVHPDLVDYLWDLVGRAHRDCACVINMTSPPLLAHPASGIIFALARGTGIVAMRLPEPERTEMLAVPGYGAVMTMKNYTLNASAIGDDWVLIKPFEKRNPELCLKAFAYAGTLS